MQRLRPRLAWVVATVVCAAAATVIMWRGEVRVWRADLGYRSGVPLDPYYLAVFSWAPAVALAWFGAGAVLLARRVQYRGFWYIAPQILILVMMATRVVAVVVEGGFPTPASLGPGTMTSMRWTLVALGGVSYVAAFVAACLCMGAAVAHTAPLAAASSATLEEAQSRQTRG